MLVFSIFVRQVLPSPSVELGQEGLPQDCYALVGTVGDYLDPDPGNRMTRLENIRDSLRRSIPVSGTQGSPFDQAEIGNPFEALGEYQSDPPLGRVFLSLATSAPWHVPWWRIVLHDSRIGRGSQAFLFCVCHSRFQTKTHASKKPRGQIIPRGRILAKRGQPGQIRRLNKQV